ncbi:hypothetical protein [Roseitranquillus sediminis]|uniref:hypothetical protein n=1 Tax=Roseitranquillus sediminis TaxID=2809051 RepID=UPI001D0C0303|nr:hypothetical protein [Roseitranquillus sediminis]MBM9594995.1 hypothetical protein [Roseitranquillus sediminis]
MRISILSLAIALAATAEACPTANTGAGCGGALHGGGAKLLVAPVTPAPYAIGDVLPRGRYFVLLNSDYYGLRPVDGFWRYYEVEGRVYRVRPDTLEILEDATGETNAAF